MTRRAAKVDDNQAAIVQALRDAFCLVQPLHMVGEGCPDIAVWSPHRGRWVFMEIKDGSKPPSRRKLTTAQREWHERFSKAEVFIVESIDDALSAAGVTETVREAG